VKRDRACSGSTARDRASCVAARRLASPGFTLLEVLIATAILAVTVVTLLGLHARNLALAAETADLTAAGVLAENVIAAAQLEPLLGEGVLEGDFSEKRDDDSENVVYGGPDSSRFEWSREVLPTLLPALKQVRVRVSLDGQTRVLAELWAAVPVKVLR
jgi:prepilin-type N-terminal cleavage/methylation domain-containing protein